MEKIKLTNPIKIKKIIDNLQLKNITLETGQDNVFIQQENKFIVKQDFLSNTVALLKKCESLEKIDMRNFDFSKIITMEWWFAYCCNLEEIIFPSNVYCNKLTNMNGTFGRTNIKHFNFTNWHFKKSLNIDLTFSSANCTSVQLGKMNIYSSVLTFGWCKNLQEVDLGKFNFLNKKILDSDKNGNFGYLFKDCPELNLVDTRNFTIEENIVDVSKVFNLHNVLFNCNEKCVVVV